jgi:hypothetical protein
MKTLIFSDIIKMHIDKFGVEPEFTGINALRSQFETMEEIMDCIDDNKPYIEEPVPDGVVI